MNIDLEQLKLDRENNFKERMKFVEYWANYVKNHSDSEWGAQQNMLIDAQLKK